MWNYKQRMSGLVAWFSTQLIVRPYITNATTTGKVGVVLGKLNVLFIICHLYQGILFAFGDAISQKLIERKEKYDWGRTCRFGLVGFFYVVS